MRIRFAAFALMACMFNPTHAADISISRGIVTIHANAASFNLSQVSTLDDGSIHVMLNAEVVDFPAGSVRKIVYIGGNGGNDSFTNNTNLPAVMHGYHGGNDFSSGTGFDFYFIYGDYNHVDDSDHGIVVTHGGDDFIYGNVIVIH